MFMQVAQAHLLCKAVAEFRAELQQQGLLLPRPGGCGTGSNGSNDGSSGGNCHNSMRDRGGSTQGYGQVQAPLEQQQQQQQQQQQFLADSLPVVLCGDFNSLWKKYLPDGFDRGVRAVWCVAPQDA
jgi:hypothetical protein